MAGHCREYLGYASWCRKKTAESSEFCPEHKKEREEYARQTIRRNRK